VTDLLRVGSRSERFRWEMTWNRFLSEIDDEPLTSDSDETESDPELEG